MGHSITTWTRRGGRGSVKCKVRTLFALRAFFGLLNFLVLKIFCLNFTNGTSKKGFKIHLNTITEIFMFVHHMRDGGDQKITKFMLT